MVLGGCGEDILLMCFSKSVFVFDDTLMHTHKKDTRAPTHEHISCTCPQHTRCNVHTTMEWCRRYMNWHQINREVAAMRGNFGEGAKWVNKRVGVHLRVLWVCRIRYVILMDECPISCDHCALSAQIRGSLWLVVECFGNLGAVKREREFEYLGTASVYACHFQWGETYCRVLGSALAGKYLSRWLIACVRSFYAEDFYARALMEKVWKIQPRSQNIKHRSQNIKIWSWSNPLNDPLVDSNCFLVSPIFTQKHGLMRIPQTTQASERVSALKEVGVSDKNKCIRFSFYAFCLTTSPWLIRMLWGWAPGTTTSTVYTFLTNANSSYSCRHHPTKIKLAILARIFPVDKRLWIHTRSHAPCLFSTGQTCTNPSPRRLGAGQKRRKLSDCATALTSPVLGACGGATVLLVRCECHQMDAEHIPCAYAYVCVVTFSYCIIYTR